MCPEIDPVTILDHGDVDVPLAHDPADDVCADDVVRVELETVTTGQVSRVNRGLPRFARAPISD
jgi:hypothetical protein